MTSSTDPLPTAAAVGAIALRYADELVVGAVREVHSAVAKRAFAATAAGTGGVSRPVEKAHDVISSGVYAGAGASLRVVAQGLRRADRRRLGPVLGRTSRGRLGISALNGIVGDRLHAEGSSLAVTTAVRHAGSDLSVRADSLARAFPSATPDVVVFVHGLGENDESWRLRAASTGGSYGDRLSEDAGWTPVYIRVNTGLPLSDNGRSVSGLLDGLVTHWPVPVRRIALIGHSMGGLILRAACALADGPGWTDRVSDVVTLGTPHLGAPLERAVHAGASALGRLPESAPFGRILEYRSVGILDLRRGLAGDVRQLPHARYRLVAATLAASPRHPASELFGDLLVRYPSAVGRPRRGDPLLPEADVMHVPRADHFSLLNHPDVYLAIRRWLAEEPEENHR